VIHPHRFVFLLETRLAASLFGTLTIFFFFPSCLIPFFFPGKPENCGPLPRVGQ